MSHDPLQNTNDWKEISQNRVKTSWKRLVERTAPFHQSSYKVNVRCKENPGDSYTKLSRRYLVFRDWFDYILSVRTTYLTLFLIGAYTAIICIWGLFYMSISCDLSNPQLDFHEAFAFALQTATTVGYTLVRDQDTMFFGGCGNWIAAIYFQSTLFMFINGFVLGVVMMRVQRANRRSRQIVFSNKACIICLRGKFYFHFQVFDLQATQPIIGVSVRLLAVFHEPSDFSPAFFQTRVMRLTRPDDETGGKLWLAVPCVVIHEIDSWSPLAPLEISLPAKVAESCAPTRFPNPCQRHIEGRIGARQQSTCFVCGVSVSTEAGLRRHIEFMAADERARGVPETFGHCSVDPKDVSRPVICRNNASKDSEKITFVDAATVRDSIRDRLRDRRVEILVVVEGMDPHTSNFMQARHSYTIDDIEFDKQHAPCMVTGPDGSPRINLSKFHELFPHPSVNIENPIPFATHS